MSAVDEAIAKNSAQAAPETFALKVGMPNGRQAVITLPLDINDGEYLQLVGILTGPARVQLAGERAKAEATAPASGRIVLPGRGILRPV